MKRSILLHSIFIYLITTIMFSIMIIIVIPVMVSIGLSQIMAYIISAGTGLFILLVLALVLYKLENNNNVSLINRFRLKYLTKSDIIAVLIGVLLILLFDGLIFAFDNLLSNNLNISMELSKLPKFTGMDQSIRNEYSIIPVYLLYLFFNIFGEELLWRGYLLPLQEIVLNRYAWVFNAIFWMIFHAIFGISIIMMIPLLFILPFFVQRQKNTWVGILMHSITGAIGFISIIQGIL
jgi:membrane protease YdiL (CAAX protease family)